MAISESEVRHVALLARLALTDEQVRHLAQELSSILDHISEIQQLDLAGVEPTAHPFPIRNVTRPDEVRPGLQRELALLNAPAASDGAFVIPRIVGVEEEA
ncbi:Asp-tRNA(Asn)/Glu-tRNA(Gln) amidotransferase subunit GatC [Coriobacteriia bacterium Es71-Z0120]|uniref:Asp-tRNA(Asn)/Glu-tRNA(Gln) amidotransferase subunit GatC n=1 Tax=Parvivirga hydrogeniphila TaxID=2939460 RepID=UPI002260F23E|nr:Asp-tRNA(Asn)/Glu-tRNA(Gln) amidotransferase subunit GatC [Parvivirga hydrogeniphila]MCL4078643.1 Asp-tRNA(Asn)/Glu-tRNA(Gln) amidotransferase subunit GatC [Parvivirga hydrogeniphila]